MRETPIVSAKKPVEESKEPSSPQEAFIAALNEVKAAELKEIAAYQKPPHKLRDVSDLWTLLLKAPRGYKPFKKLLSKPKKFITDAKALSPADVIAHEQMDVVNRILTG